MRAVVEQALREALAEPSLRLARLAAVGGGCVNHAARAETTAGAFFVKWNEEGPEDLFLREAEGLRALGAAGSELAVPRVHAALAPAAGRPAMIVMEYLPPGEGPADDEALGRGLAAVHRATAPAYGFPVPTYCGTTPQDNAWTGDWVDFFRERRLGAILRLVEEERGLPAADRRVYDRLLARLPSLLAHPATPSLNHGDLWSGNVVHTTRGPGLVDPACAYADREMELGIVTMFGGFSPRFWAAYEEAWPLPSDWRERNPVYQLYHVLNHQRLFGGHYGPQALAIARRYV